MLPNAEQDMMEFASRFPLGPLQDAMAFCAKARRANLDLTQMGVIFDATVSDEVRQPWLEIVNVFRPDRRAEIESIVTAMLKAGIVPHRLRSWFYCLPTDELRKLAQQTVGAKLAAVPKAVAPTKEIKDWTELSRMAMRLGVRPKFKGRSLDELRPLLDELESKLKDADNPIKPIRVMKHGRKVPKEVRELVDKIEDPEFGKRKP